MNDREIPVGRCQRVRKETGERGVHVGVDTKEGQMARRENKERGGILRERGRDGAIGRAVGL